METFQFKSKTPASLRHRVAQEIRDAIIQGHLKPGDKLKELEIAHQMGISRGPVREALRDLEAMGLVLSQPYRETVVVSTNREEIEELLIPIRLQLELYSIRVNLDQFDDALFQTLREIVESMREAASRNDLHAVVEEDMRFHESIITFSQHSFSNQIWNGITNRLHLHFIKNTSLFPDLRKVPDDHDMLLNALNTRDYEQIKEIWIQHIRHHDSLLYIEEEAEKGN